MTTRFLPEPELAHVEAVLSEAFGTPVGVAAVQTEPIPLPSVFPADLVSVALADGTGLSLFVKHLGNEQADHPDKQDRQREVRVYDSLLRDPGLPVPRYYGSRWNAATQHTDVYLEYVPDWSLKYTDLEHWFTAARRLAHLQAHFGVQTERLLGCDFLLRLDAAYFCAWAERALSAVIRHAPQLAPRLETVVCRYTSIAELLGRQPLTLVHNDLAPKNVLAHRAWSPARICLVDWEMAGLGCGALDIVHLKYGLDPTAEHRMRTEYCAELVETGLLPTHPREVERLFAACEAHQTMCRLAYFDRWGTPPARVAEWVREVERSCVGVTA